MQFSIGELRNAVGPRIFARGEEYFQNGAVEILEITDEYIEAEVWGTELYQVELRDIEAGYIDADCTCPYWDICKHIVAVALEANDYPEIEHTRGNSETTDWQRYFAQINSAAEQTSRKRSYQLVYTFTVESGGWSLHPQKRMIKKDGTPGVPRNLGFADFGDSQVQRSRNDDLVLSFLEKWTSAHSYYYGYYYSRPADYRFEFGAGVGVVFDLLRESQVHFPNKNGKEATLIYHDSNGEIEFRLLKQKEGALNFCPYLMLDGKETVLDSNFCILASEPLWLLQGNRLIKILGEHDVQSLIPFTREDYKISVAMEDVSAFLETIASRPKLFNHFRLPDYVETESVDEIEEKRLYLREVDDGIEVQLRFSYGQVEVDANDSRHILWGSKPEAMKFVKVTRDYQAETEARHLLLSTAVKVSHDGVITTRKNKTLDWLHDDIQELLGAGFVVYSEENLQRFKVNRAAASVRVTVNSGIDWFDLDLQIDFGGILLSLAEIKRAMKQKSEYIKLADGSSAKLPKTWLNRFRHVINLGEESQKGLRLSHFHVTLIDELFAEAHERNADNTFNEKLQRLKDFDGINEFAVPSGLQGALRPYQHAGYNWLHFLREYQFGGCLADDMGLGKTIQALAILQWEVEDGVKGPNLIITPTSVVFNWLNEIAKFTPALRVLNQTGVDRERVSVNYEDYHIVLTSYGTLRRDIVFLKDVSFNYVILDESQNIKNPVSQTARAAKLLKARHRLALTGTPVENNTIELWSLFAFLNPGLLGNLNYFKSAFAKPIEKEQDAPTADLLKKTIFPFMLRRTKEKVALDLPPKVENILYSGMTMEHEKVYNKWRDYYRALILKQIADAGIDQSRMNVLGGLMKLRQIACHPILVEETFPGKVGKYEALLENLEEIMAEGHKVLVFSQFVKMLTIFRKYLDSARIPYAYLDGKTRDRKACVERFQTDTSCKIFLISLKAGGTGLNLTAADYVIHYDPWWNPAVEAQATDRSHRIGQDKHVFVYKMITKGTVEEKIMQLQECKKELVSKLVTTDAGLFKQLTVTDIEELFS